MLTYTFSRREKALILLFVVILLALAWYVFVYSATTERMMHIDSEIAQTEIDTTRAQAKVSEMNFMKKVIEEQKAAGATPKPIPNYDNVQPLMADLDAVMARTTSYQLNFEDIDLTDESYIQRPVRISFNCGSYEEAESIVDALANGPYTCLIDSVAFTDNTATRTANTAVAGVVHVIFYEKYPEDKSVVPDTSGKKSSSSKSTSSKSTSTKSSK